MKNPTMLTLLKMGCTIEFKNGYKISGDIKNNYINCFNEFGPDGLRILDRKGCESALKDAKNYNKE